MDFGSLLVTLYLHKDGLAVFRKFRERCRQRALLLSGAKRPPRAKLQYARPLACLALKLGVYIVHVHWACIL